MSICSVESKSSFSSCVSPIFKPFQVISDKVRKIAEAIFSYIVWIITFQMGAMQSKGSYFIIRFYQRFISCDPRDGKPFDPERLQASKGLLLRHGGVEAILEHPGHNSSIHCMTFKSNDFMQALCPEGVQEIQVQYKGKIKRALLNPPETVKKFHFPIVSSRMQDGSIQRVAILPDRCPSRNPPHILHSHSPGRSMCMDRKLVGQYLAAGYDLTIWDPRGTAESTGKASEGGYYLDADLVFQHLQAQGIDPARIYASGFCEGASMATYLKQKYHHLGVHLIASNPYTSMEEVLKQNGFLGKLAARYGVEGITDRSIQEVTQDYFNNVEKLKNLPSSEGKCIIIHTDTDTMMPRGTATRMIEAFGNAGPPAIEILSIHPNPKENGHLQPPTEREDVWRRFVQVVV